MENINRRKFIKVAGGAAVIAAQPAISATKNTKYDAIVVGAGLSGLHAAMILEESGLNVLVLEGRDRLGGRVYTLMDVPGKPEAAGEVIGANYARMISTVNKLGLKMFDPEMAGIDRGWAYNIKGQFIEAADWESHELNPMEAEDRKVLPHRMLWDITNKDNPLRGYPLDAWLTSEFAQYDIPFDDYLRALGYNDETIRLMGVTVHTSHVGKTSALSQLRRYHVSEFNSKAITFPDGKNWKQVEGGNSLLPQAMSDSLKRRPLLNKTVVHFEQDSAGVTVYCSDGTSYSAGSVVCSIPLTVMRNVTFAPRMPKHIRGAVDEVEYGVSIQAHYKINKRYWEEDGMSPHIWSDGLLERFGARNVEPGQGQPAGVAFINGEEAAKFNLMPDQDVFTYIEKLLVDMRPSMAGALEPITIQSCERDVHGAGDWVYWQPGQVEKYAKTMRDSHGRIHFCGEHTAIMERGMEGAFESGERAALDVLFSS